MAIAFSNKGAVRVALEVVTGGMPLPAPPYPADTRAGNYAMPLDVHRVHQSTTFILAPDELRPWLVFLWHESWAQIPMGSLPADDAMIAAIIRMPPATFAVHKSTLLRGWKRHLDGRLYHDYLTGLVLGVLRVRARYKRHREKDSTQVIENERRNVVATLAQRADVDVDVDVNKSSSKPLVAGSPSPPPSKPPRQQQRTKLGTRLADNWRLPEEWHQIAQAIHPDWSSQGIVRESITFRDYWTAKAGKDATKLNWLATWRTWIRRAEHEPER